MTSTLMRSLCKSLVASSNVSKLLTSAFTSKASTGTYKAAMVKEIKAPLVFETRQREKLKKNQVRIRVQYCNVNLEDCAALREGSKHKFPFVPGYELTGEVLELGSDVTKDQFLKGERVAALNLDKFGGFSEECVVDVNDCWQIPSNVEAKDAAALIYDHSKAIYTFSILCHVHELEDVVVSTGPAGLGLAAIDVIANMYKAKVIAVTDTEARAEYVRNKGAFMTINFNGKLPMEVYKLTHNDGVPVVYDAVGDYMMETVSKCAAVEGKIFLANPFTSKTIPAPPPNRQLTIVDLHDLRLQRHEDFRTIVADSLELANQGILTPYIGATYSLEDANKAIEFMETKESNGKVIIEIDD